MTPRIDVPGINSVRCEYVRQQMLCGAPASGRLGLEYVSMHVPLPLPVHRDLPLISRYDKWSMLIAMCTGACPDDGTGVLALTPCPPLTKHVYQTMVHIRSVQASLFSLFSANNFER